MGSSSCSFFTAIFGEQGDLIGKLGVTPATLGNLLSKYMNMTDLAVSKIDRSRLRPIKNLYNCRVNETLKVNATYNFIDEKGELCQSCRKIQKLKAVYTFINIENNINFSVTNLQVHFLRHGNFECLNIDPLHLNRVLGIGYFSGET